jgi:hypothetical protein
MKIFIFGMKMIPSGNPVRQQGSLFPIATQREVN